MKLWKPVLYTTLLFSAIVSNVLYSSCEKNPCNNVECFNGGSCGGNGICQCPVGYENAQCQDKAVTRYLGMYAGTIRCDTRQEVIDTVWIKADTSKPNKINYVWVIWKSQLPKVFHGYVRNQESTYSVVFENEVAPNYVKIYTLTLQGFNGPNNKLSMHSYERNTITPGDTVQIECSFLGFKNAK